MGIRCGMHYGRESGGQRAKMRRLTGRVLRPETKFEGYCTRGIIDNKEQYRTIPASTACAMKMWRALEG